jgi:hypothetical protein
MRGDGHKVPIWRTRDIKEHIETHVINPVIFIGEQIRNWTQELYITKQLHYRIKSNNYGQEVFESEIRNIRTSMEITRLIKELYKTNPKEMNFYNENWQINITEVGKLINIHKHFETEIT